MSVYCRRYDDRPFYNCSRHDFLKAKGSVWHKSSMNGVVPCPGIDTDAKWGYSHTKGWVFGYKLHITSTTGDLVGPLTADVTTANVQDN